MEGDGSETVSCLCSIRFVFLFYFICFVFILYYLFYFILFYFILFFSFLFFSFLFFSFLFFSFLSFFSLFHCFSYSLFLTHFKIIFMIIIIILGDYLIVVKGFTRDSGVYALDTKKMLEGLLSLLLLLFAAGD